MYKKILKLVPALFVGLFLVTACGDKAGTGTGSGADSGSGGGAPASISDDKFEAAKTIKGAMGTVTEANLTAVVQAWKKGVYPLIITEKNANFVVNNGTIKTDDAGRDAIYGYTPDLGKAFEKLSGIDMSKDDAPKKVAEVYEAILKEQSLKQFKAIVTKLSDLAVDTHFATTAEITAADNALQAIKTAANVNNTLAGDGSIDVAATAQAAYDAAQDACNANVSGTGTAAPTRGQALEHYGKADKNLQSGFKQCMDAIKASMDKFLK